MKKLLIGISIALLSACSLLQANSPKEKVKELIRKDNNMKLTEYQKGKGKEGSKYERCQWIDVRFCDDQSRAASILFYEDFRADVCTGNLHPGRYGYVTFQKWNNDPINRPAPNIKLCIGGLTGVFIPIDKEHHLETQINVLDGEVDSVSESIFKLFNKFVYKGENK